MKNNDYQTIQKIIRYCDDVATILSKNDVDLVKFENDVTFEYACNMCIIQIGELVGRLSDDFQSEHPDIPWHAIKAMRNLYAHDYERINLSIVWDTLTKDVPKLKKQLEALL